MSDLLLVDLSHIFWTNWHATKDKALGEAFELTVSAVARCAKGYKHVALCVDCPPYKRKEIAASYKANREAAPPAAQGQFARVKERLAADGYLLWGKPGFEADDAVASATRWARQGDPPLKVTIASNDKDLMQLIGDGVGYVSTATDQPVTAETVMTKFGVRPDQLGDLLALTGDTSDNIPGVPGIGPKKAAALLNHFGTLEEVLVGIVDAKQSATRDAIIKHTEDARLSRKLVTLETDVPIDFDAIFLPRQVKPLVETRREDLDAVDDDDVDDLLGLSKPAAKTAPETEPAKLEVAPPEGEAFLVGETKPEPPKPKVTVTETAIARREPQVVEAKFEMQLQPRSLTAAAALGESIFNARLFEKFANQDQVTAVILRGRELGITALTACSVFHVFEGQLTLSAHLIAAMAEQHPDCEYFMRVGGDDTYAEWETKHRKQPMPVRYKYTIDQAKQAGLCPEVIRDRPEPGQKDSRKAWEKRPAQLLSKTCKIILARDVFPSAALGLLSIEELGGEAA